MAETTYSVKFMCGALQGEWMRGQKFRDVVKLYNILAQTVGTDVQGLYKSAFIKDADGHPTVFTYKGESVNPFTGKPRYSGVLYIVKEYDW